MNEPRPEDHLGAPVRHGVERGEALEDADRVVGAEHGDRGAEADPLGAPGDGGQHDLGRGDGEVVAVVLADAEEVEAEAVGEHRLARPRCGSPAACVRRSPSASTVTSPKVSRPSSKSWSTPSATTGVGRRVPPAVRVVLARPPAGGPHPRPWRGAWSAGRMQVLTLRVGAFLRTRWRGRAGGSGRGRGRLGRGPGRGRGRVAGPRRLLTAGPRRRAETRRPPSTRRTDRP